MDGGHEGAHVTGKGCRPKPVQLVPVDVGDVVYWRTKGAPVGENQYRRAVVVAVTDVGTITVCEDHGSHAVRLLTWAAGDRWRKKGTKVASAGAAPLE